MQVDFVPKIASLAKEMSGYPKPDHVKYDDLMARLLNPDAKALNADETLESNQSDLLGAALAAYLLRRVRGTLATRSPFSDILGIEPIAAVIASVIGDEKRIVGDEILKCEKLPRIEDIPGFNDCFSSRSLESVLVKCARYAEVGALAAKDPEMPIRWSAPAAYLCREALQVAQLFPAMLRDEARDWAKDSVRQAFRKSPKSVPAKELLSALAYLPRYLTSHDDAEEARLQRGHFPPAIPEPLTPRVDFIRFVRVATSPIGLLRTTQKGEAEPSLEPTEKDLFSALYHSVARVDRHTMLAKVWNDDGLARLIVAALLASAAYVAFHAMGGYEWRRTLDASFAGFAAMALLVTWSLTTVCYRFFTRQALTHLKHDGYWSRRPAKWFALRQLARAFSDAPEAVVTFVAIGPMMAGKSTWLNSAAEGATDPTKRDRRFLTRLEYKDRSLARVVPVAAPGVNYIQGRTNEPRVFELGINGFVLPAQIDLENRVKSTRIGVRLADLPGEFFKLGAPEFKQSKLYSRADVAMIFARVGGHIVGGLGNEDRLEFLKKVYGEKGERLPRILLFVLTNCDLSSSKDPPEYTKLISKLASWKGCGERLLNKAITADVKLRDEIASAEATAPAHPSSAATTRVIRTGQLETAKFKETADWATGAGATVYVSQSGAPSASGLMGQACTCGMKGCTLDGSPFEVLSYIVKQCDSEPKLDDGRRTARTRHT